jgi:hypothetical protein
VESPRPLRLDSALVEEPIAEPPADPFGLLIEPEPEPVPSEPATPHRPSACNEQAPQPFLMRGAYAYDPKASPEESARRKVLHREAIEYRTRRYGYVDGFGDPRWNRYEPKHFTAASTFFGIRVRMNARVLVALGCVEEDIRQSCSATPYTPRVLDGLRFRNTFHNGEVTNHAYGIAIDVDWDKNSCCGCNAPLNHARECREPAASPYDRTYIPKCWVDVFERYGFYWLGNDQLEDTMHFEFLGDPSRISSAIPPPADGG